MSCNFVAQETSCLDLNGIRVTTKAPGYPTPEAVNRTTWHQNPDDSSLDNLNLIVCNSPLNEQKKWKEEDQKMKRT
jgi:hypothetical protein